MPKATRKRKLRKDKLWRLAKEQGYRSPAAIKLLHLDRLFSFLPTVRAVLDLGAAPGGWVQIAVRSATPGSFVVGVRPWGRTFVTKFIRSQHQDAIMFCLNQLFEKVQLAKPAAISRIAEIYFVCLEYKAPARIQPELFDLNHLLTMSLENKPREEDVVRYLMETESRGICRQAGKHTVLETMSSFRVYMVD
jgi:hypothetical protein